ncbi:MAG TPA: acetamidase/formamidase family protein [Gaiellaceae bacterium]|nr:acetamidase/formamidase family protein [Gaiellaceae bacterium]
MLGHNRWHPGVEPLKTVRPGELVTLDAPLGSGDQIGPESTSESLLELDLSDDLLVGPVYVEGAEPGDVLVVDLVAVEPESFGFSAVFPGFGVLADLFTDPFLVTWQLDRAFGRSDTLPGFRIPADPFPGTIGLAPSTELMDAVRRREDVLLERAGLDLSEFTPRPVPAHAADGLGTLPPREIGGNLDLRQFVQGARLFLPVHVPGALLSVGDCHYAQGDGEVCGSAIEIGAQVTLRLDVVRGGAWRPRFPALETAERPTRRAFATTGIPLTDGGDNELLDLGLAMRRALLEMIDFLEAVHGLSRQAAYVLISVAAEVRIAEAVDLPNALVSVALPVDVFERYGSPA